MPTTQTIDVAPGRLWIRNDDGSPLAVSDSRFPLTITANGVPALPFTGWLLAGSSEAALDVPAKPGRTTLQCSSLLLSGAPLMSWSTGRAQGSIEPSAWWYFGKTAANTVLDVPLDGVLGRVQGHVHGQTIGRVSIHQITGTQLVVSRNGTAPVVSDVSAQVVEFWGDTFAVRYSVAGVPTLRVIAPDVATFGVKAA